MVKAQLRQARTGLAMSVIAIVAGLLFSAVVGSHAATDGLCCGDDAAIALAAKSLSQGNGYSLPLNFIGESGRFAFHHGLSTGPTLVLPAAAMMVAFGPQIWVPSVTSAILSISLLALLVILVGRTSSREHAVRFGLALIVALYVLTANGIFFVHWYALLGEIPAGLLLVIAAWWSSSTCADGRVGAKRAILAGLASGLAVNSKLLALLGALAIGSIYAYHWLRGGGRTAFRDGLIYTGSMLFPMLTFEIFRLYSLGVDGYVLWLHGMREFFGGHAPGSLELEGGGIAQAKLYLSSLRASTGTSPAFWLLPLMAPVLWIKAIRSESRFLRASVLCWLAGSAYAVWWLFFSNGWPRYGLIGFILLVSAVVFACVPLKRLVFLPALAALLICIAPWSSMQQLLVPIRYTINNGFLENERVTSLRQVARYINGASGRDEVVAGSWWAPLVIIEYVSNEQRKTVGFNRMHTARPDLAGTILLKSDRWEAMSGSDKDPAFQKFVNACRRPLVVTREYSLYDCKRSID